MRAKSGGRGGAMDIRWTHITITVSNLERSIDFYTTFCGFSVVRDRRLEGGGTVWLGSNPARGKNPTFLLVLGQGEVTSTMDHLGFQCALKEQVDEIAERGRKLRILVEPPTDAGGSVGYFTMIRDPDGHLVEFTYGQPIEGLT
jgi:lactoylglutathione lyase